MREEIALVELSDQRRHRRGIPDPAKGRRDAEAKRSVGVFQQRDQRSRGLLRPAGAELTNGLPPNGHLLLFIRCNRNDRITRGFAAVDEIKRPDRMPASKRRLGCVVEQCDQRLDCLRAVLGDPTLSDKPHALGGVRESGDQIGYRSIDLLAHRGRHIP